MLAVTMYDVSCTADHDLTGQIVWPAAQVSSDHLTTSHLYTSVM